MSTNRSRITRLTALVAAFFVMSFLVVNTSSAVFNATTENDGNQITADTVTLTDDDSDSALFAVSGVVPNDTITRCIEVTYGGSATGADLGAVKVYANSDYNDSTGDFDTQLNFTLQIAASGETCATATPTWTELTSSDTIASFSAAHSDYSNGASSGWTPASTPETRAFQVSVEFDGAADNTYQNAALGTTTGFKLTWEIQSGSGSAK